MTRLHASSRDLTHWIVALAMGIAVYLIGCHFAHAGVAATATATAPATGIDWNFWLAVGAVALGALSTLLHIVAPRTKATWDDALRDDVDKLIEFTGIGRPAQNVVPLPPRDKQAGFIRIDTMFAIGGLVGMALAIASLCGWGCTASQARQTAAVGVMAALDCELVHVDAALADDLRAAALAKVDDWLSGKAPADLSTLVAKVKADLGGFKSDAGRCAIAGVLAAAASLVTPRPGVAEQGLVALPVGPPPAMVRAAFGLAAREAGLPPIKVAGAVI